MAKKATKSSGSATKTAKRKSPKKGAAKATARKTSAKASGGGGDSIRKLLESPLVADLLAVGATAALAAIAQHGFGKGQGKGTSKAVKAAGKAAATAMGQRLGTEFDEIRKVAKAKSAAKA
jgi:hypothetical protein